MIRMLSTIMPVSLHGARAETTRIVSSGASRICNCSAAPDAIRSMSSLSSGAYGFVGGTCARLLAARGVPVLPQDRHAGYRSASALCATLAVNVTGKDRTWGGQRRPGGDPARSAKLAEKPFLGGHGKEIKQFGGRPRHERLRQDRHLADHLGGDVEHGPLPRRIGLGERPGRLAGEIP